MPFDLLQLDWRSEECPSPSSPSSSPNCHPTIMGTKQMLLFSLPAPLHHLHPSTTNHLTTRITSPKLRQTPRASLQIARKLVIGLNQYSHDTSISIADATTNQILFALSKERLTRRKHDGGHVADLLPHALRSLADDWHCSVPEVTNCVQIVIANNHHFRIAPFEQSVLFQQALHYIPPPYTSPWNLFSTSVPAIQHIPTTARKIELSHHLAHAFSTLRDVHFDRGLLVVMDGMGDALNDWLQGRQEETSLSQTYFTEICTPDCICRDSKHFREFPTDVHTRPGASFREAESVYIFQRNPRNRAIVSLERLYKRWTPEVLPSELTNHSFEHMFSVGAMYSRVSAIIFRDWNACGKVMGLAPFGAPAGKKKRARFFMRGNLIDGTLDVAAGQQAGLQHLGQTFADTPDNPALRQHFEHLAYEIQADLQTIILDFVTDLVKITGIPDVIFTGGIAHNSCVNGLLADCPSVRSLFVPPYPGDEGIAIGCANFGTLLSHLASGDTVGNEGHVPRYARMPFFGRLYSDENVLRTVGQFSPWVEWRAGPSVQRSARGLADGKIIAWFSGRSEFGPRALGHRSLLANPRDAGAKTRMNDLVKRREGYRPFAPVVLQEVAGEWFEGCEHVSCEFMAMTRGVVGGERIPAVVHVDGSARVQVLAEGGGNERFVDLLKEFWSVGGVPVVLNTSFNVAGEPIVESPFDALRTFLKNDGIDLLAFPNGVVERREWRDVGLEDGVRSGCRWFRSRLVQDCYGECVTSELIFVPVWRVEAEAETDGEAEEVEETVPLMDGLQVEILERIHGYDDCRVGDVVEAFCEDDCEDGPSESDIVERILDLFQKLVVYKI